MLSLFIVLYVLIGVQGKAFPNRYKRNYEAGYYYSPGAEDYVQLSSRYPLEDFQSYQDYVHGYVQTDGHDWSAYYERMVPQQIQDSVSNINEHHKVKAKHTWHFIDQNHAPVTQYMVGRHFESDVEAPNVIEALVRKEVIGRPDVEHDIPIVVEALIKKDHENADIGEILNSFKKKHTNYESDVNPVVIDSAVKNQDFLEYRDKSTNLDLLAKLKPSISPNANEPVKNKPLVAPDAFQLPLLVDSLSKKDKPVKVEPTPRYMHGANKDKPIKHTPSISTDEFELPDVMASLKQKDKPIKVEPESAVSYMDTPIKHEKPFNRTHFISSDKLELPEVVDSLKQKYKPVEVESAASFNYEPIKHEKLFNRTHFIPSDKFELPEVVDSLKQKDKPVEVASEPAASFKYEPIKHEKPIKLGSDILYSAPNHLVGFDSFYKESKPEYETPLVIEALVRKEKPSLNADDDFERPVLVESLVRKFPNEYENEKTSIKENKISKDLFYPVKESNLSKKLDSTSINEVLTLKKDSDYEASEDDITFQEIHGFDQPDIENLDENGDNKSASFNGSRFARSLFPVNSNTVSTVTNIKEQKKLKFKSCVTPKNETGNCMPFQQCSVFSAISNIDELVRNVCLIDEVFIGVCCPEFPVETVRVDWEQLKPDKAMLTEEKSQILNECGRLASTATDRDPWPWMASLIAKSSEKIFCGGALVNEKYVLTAAHCTIRIPRNQILVGLGRPASENSPAAHFEVIEIKRHAGYNPKTMQNDIALLKLSRRVQLGDFRRVVCLPEEKEDTDTLVNEIASLLRWKETPGKIKDVEPLLVISSQECQSRMRTAVSDSILCSEPRTDETMCNADSGAPLIIAKDGKFEVIGILTWNRNDCDERFPTVFTSVSSYRRWIEKLAS